MGHLITCNPCGGDLTIDGTSMHESRWCVTDLFDLWENDQGGEDVEIAGIDGVIPYPRRFAETRYLLPLVITGWVDDYGLPLDCSVTDAMQQLRANVAALKAAAVGPVGTDGTRTAVYVTDDAETWTAPVHVLDIRKDAVRQGWWAGNLEIVLTKPWTVT